MAEFTRLEIVAGIQSGRCRFYRPYLMRCGGQRRGRRELEHSFLLLGLRRRGWDSPGASSRVMENMAMKLLQWSLTLAVAGLVCPMGAVADDLDLRTPSVSHSASYYAPLDEQKDSVRCGQHLAARPPLIRADRINDWRLSSIGNAKSPERFRVEQAAQNEVPVIHFDGYD